MTSSFKQLFLMNLRLVYRNTSGIFFTLVMPAIIYIALSVLPIGGSFGGKFNYSQFLLPGIIAMTIMQGGIYGLAYWMIDLKSRGVIKRYLVTPLSQGELVISVLASRIIVAIVQAVFLALVGIIFFHVQVSVTALLVIPLIVLGGGIFLMVGLLISMFADSYEAAAPITTAVGLPLTFLGNIFFATDGLPKVLKFVSELLPITYLSDAVRGVFLSNSIPSKVWTDALVLLVWFVVILAFTLWKFRLKE
ncbi:MAG TPA: ABC transporter permease [Patescibacteria group bacterium]|nr:ABC transporter permease [Patescibacteria group bacterium]